LLVEVDKKLADAGRSGLCAHCGERAGGGSEGLCSRCTAYRRKYNRLPSEETLVESSRRRTEREQRPPDRRPRGSRSRNRP
jgi:NMD protein affecting ribosome stability and mRNA decay